MLDAFAIALREIAEIALIVGALCAHLTRNHHARLLKSVKSGVMVGLIPGVAVAVLFAGATLDAHIEAILEIATAFGVFAMAAGMMGSAREIRGRVDERLQAWLGDRSTAAPLVIFAFVAMAVGRETLEMAVFFQAIANRQSVGEVLLGLALGALCATLVAALWRIARWRSGLLLAFRASALLLSLLAVKLFLHGASELIRWLMPGQTDAVPRGLDAFLEGGQHHIWLSAMLTGAVLLHAARNWWFQTQSGRHDAAG